MGSLCSKSSTLSGGHTVLGSSSSSPQGAPAARPDPRSAAAEAAERRMKAAQARGTTTGNPNQGRLAAQLEANKKVAKVPEQREEERLVWD
ncbi:hypothetical protein JAAARDRAFT_189279 [Jaapia argillacea MUCL 33604]|uniref:Uncharacterized protein n=1 Tax=Jaapia argillacea MUCL 33604 TaxID=933084 RepID=A0A067Q9K9_9AGAM|nr:hypothetical protein JAAARDRAFT_189279 [Jaapia argillacea MUCL 33604]